MSAKSKPDSYREPQQFCGSCKHVFFVLEWEECTRYFCMYNAPRRPLCGSSRMGEGFSRSIPEGLTPTQNDRWWSCRMNAWAKWSKEREVERLGVCDHYEYEKPMELTMDQFLGGSSTDPIWKR